MHPITGLQNPAVKGTSTGQMEADRGAGDASVRNHVTCKDMRAQERKWGEKEDELDNKNGSLVKIAAVEDCCVGSAAHLARWFVVAVFGGVAFRKTMETEIAFW